ncbi:glycosyltransferase family 10 domain-containing protein [cf. Phormidesmis sp. LEGE 11477]|uniref:glycosyltransferase family 10 domain-containing protein n=1 Tax=cf. Phormidesmis sp. LEGE 11477 TaxID=1828680 RepID=UPI00187DF7D4|nr:glycosyltransferase family 10 [cf. Phormidesmis sp. LEGE 11477]MBE9064943.1 hypothetical protein [cf. Phormidesmis sp. LEGE 11477]
MQRVHVATTHDAFPYFRQTPAGDGRWGNVQFALEDPDERADWLVVFDEPSVGLETNVPVERRILFVWEPPELKVYDLSYLDQFGTVVSPVPLPGYGRHWVQSQSALPWFVGVDMRDGVNIETMVNEQGLLDAKGWDEVLDFFDAPKTKLLSVVCSNKTRLEGQRERLAFVEALKVALGDQVDVFGRGFNRVNDKAEALASYKYHIALENNRHDHFWTEKLADAYLGGTFPIHAGCQNLSEYFPQGSYASIDIRDIEASVETVKRVISADPWGMSRQLRLAARDKVMMEHNVFAIVVGILEENANSARSSQGSGKSKSQISPNGYFLSHGTKARLARWYGYLRSWAGKVREY